MIIPIEHTPVGEEFSVTLDGEDYTLGWYYNRRTDSYFVDLDKDGERVISGARVCTDWPLFRPYVDDRLPPGELWAISTTEDKSPPTEGDFGERIVLMYRSAEGGG